MNNYFTIIIKKCRHDKIADFLLWDIFRKYGFPRREKSYEHYINSEIKVFENQEVKLLTSHLCQKILRSLFRSLWEQTLCRFVLAILQRPHGWLPLPWYYFLRKNSHIKSQSTNLPHILASNVSLHVYIIVQSSFSCTQYLKNRKCKFETHKHINPLTHKFFLLFFALS